jgi:nucleotide-binding universal stress UspA family protein
VAVALSNDVLLNVLNGRSLFPLKGAIKMMDSRLAKIVRPARILLATDFSKNSESAYPYAVALAKENKSELILVHVVTKVHGQSWMAEMGPQVSEFRDLIVLNARKPLDQVKLGDTEGVSMRREVISAKTPASGLVRMAGEEDVDLIVMATRGHGVLHQRIMGCVAREVIRSAPCPILCVKPGERGLLNKYSKRIQVQRLLVPSDFSDNSLNALRVGSAIAKSKGSEMRVLYVSEAQVPPMYRSAGIESLFRIDPDMPLRIRDGLEKMLAQAKGEEIACEIDVHEGDPSREVARYADTENVDLIVVSRLGIGYTPHLLGGVADRLLHDVKRPLLAI